MDSGRHSGVGRVFVRALFAFAMLMVASLQPGMVVTAKAVVDASQAETFQQTAPHDHGSAHGDHAVQAPSCGNDASHLGDGSTADLCCDMNCMPATGVPPRWLDLAHPSAGAFGRIASGPLTSGETHELVRPPRT